MILVCTGGARQKEKYLSGSVKFNILRKAKLHQYQITYHKVSHVTIKCLQCQKHSSERNILSLLSTVCMQNY